MKVYKLLIILVIFFSACLFSREAHAGVAELIWNANTEGDLAGYKVYWGNQARSQNNNSYSDFQDVGNVTTHRINNIGDTGTTYFAVTAYDNSGNESEFSAEAKKTPGDINKDGSVNMLDVQGVVDNYNKSGCDNVADINLDCAVNMLDVGALVSNYGITGQ